jgi:hypothetical protein
VRYLDPDGRENGMPSDVHDILRRSGGLPYKPEKWNDQGFYYDKKMGYATYGDPNSIQYRTNCYAYAFDLKANPLTGKDFISCLDIGPFAMQPGMYCGLSCNEEIINNPEMLVGLIEADAKALNYYFEKTGLYIPVKEGHWKVALVIAPTDENGVYDYHWYRLNEDGTWSHKPGAFPVTNLDGSGNIITDPKIANRNSIDGTLSYSIFVGYFEVGKCGIDEY